MKKLKEKHVRFLKEKVGRLNEFLPLTKTSLNDLFHHLHQASTVNITNAIGTEEPFDPSFAQAAEELIQEIDPEDFDFADANTRLDQ